MLHCTAIHRPSSPHPPSCARKPMAALDTTSTPGTPLAAALPAHPPAPLRASKATTSPSSLDTRKDVGCEGFHVSASTSDDILHDSTLPSGCRTSACTPAHAQRQQQQQQERSVSHVMQSFYTPLLHVPGVVWCCAVTCQNNINNTAVRPAHNQLRRPPWPSPD